MPPLCDYSLSQPGRSLGGVLNCSESEWERPAGLVEDQMPSEGSDALLTGVRASDRRGTARRRPDAGLLRRGLIQV
jgi:hypothetical protein